MDKIHLQKTVSPQGQQGKNALCGLPITSRYTVAAYGNVQGVTAHMWLPGRPDYYIRASHVCKKCYQNAFGRYYPQP